MTDENVDCLRVDEDELVERYLAGRLSDDEAEWFESHYFSCDRCWAEVERAGALRAVLAEDQQPSAVAPRRGVPWWPLAAAAAMMLAALGIRQITRPAGAPSPGGGPEVTRGAPAAALPVRVGAPARTAAWPALAGAASYRVRLFAPDGTLLFDRETPDTSLAAAEASDTLVYWQVEALDSLHTVLQRSTLTPERLVPPPR